MILDSKKTKVIIILCLTVAFVVGSLIIVVQEVGNVENVISERVTERGNKIKEKIVLIQSYIKTMRDTMQYSISQHEHVEHYHPAMQYLKYNQQFNISAIDEISAVNWLNIQGTLLSKYSDSEITDKVKNEMSAALYLSATFLSALKYIPDIKWVYYFSEKNFIYTVPYHSLDMFILNEQTYHKEYWVKAIPKNNPERRIVMTNVYIDDAGKGDMVTFSVPVYLNNAFKGIIAIDVSLNSFNLILSNNSIYGTSFLIDETHKKLESDSVIKTKNYPLQTKHKFQNDTIYHDSDGNDYFSVDIIKGEVTLIHLLDRKTKYKLATLNSLRELMLLLSLMLMAYMIYYSRVLIYKVGRYANLDPLTSLLNRRAMENAVLPLLSISERYEQKMCFLLADIDYFKNVNDTYGHVMGDDILVSVTAILNSCLRSSDLLSRHGGEEFFIALPQTDLESGFLLAERIRTSIENTRTGEQRVAVTISIGCVEVQKDEDFDTAISRADKMLYQAKSDGRNRTVSDSSPV